MQNLHLAIGSRISGLRRLNGMTQEQLAEKLDITVKHVSSVERGQSSLSLEKLVDLSEILNCSLDYLILGKESSDANNHIPSFVSEIYQNGTEEEKSLLTQYLMFYKRLKEKIRRPDINPISGKQQVKSAKNRLVLSLFLFNYTPLVSCCIHLLSSFV